MTIVGAIANSRLVGFDGERVTFKWKNYRAKLDARYKLMTLHADEFIRRFLIHILPDGFHCIRHYGLLANTDRADNIALARRFLGLPAPAPSSGESSGTDGGHEGEEWRKPIIVDRGGREPERMRESLPF